jgi:hypothetical protein
MEIILIVLMVVAALLTLGVLVRGIFIMASGRDVSGRQSNKLMTWRVGLQALAILFIVLLFLLNRQG